MTTSTASLPLMLKQLNLSAMSQHWPQLARDAGEHHWSYEQFLYKLAEEECLQRLQNRIARYIKESKLPIGKSLANFQFDATPSINRAQITALAQNPIWVHQAENVLLFGPSGTGKTHLASAIGYGLIEQSIRVLFINTAHLIQQMQLARKEYRLPALLDKLARIPLLILDEISYVKKTELETSVLFELIAQRYENKSLMITSNQPFSEWDQIFPNSAMAVAAIDRLVHHATIINIKEKSFRQTHHQAETALSQENTSKT